MKVRIILEVEDNDLDQLQYGFKEFLDAEVIPQAEDLGFSIEVKLIEEIK
jgi:hypothetical protein